MSGRSTLVLHLSTQRIEAVVALASAHAFLDLLADLVGQPTTTPDVDLLHGATALADDPQELVERRSDGALLEIRIEDDHEFVMTHAGNPPPLD